MKTYSMLAAAAAIAGVATPAAAQTTYPYPQQGYPQQYQQTYPQSGYGQAYGQGYAQNSVGQIIDSLLGNRYQANDRSAVTQCAAVALAQASRQYSGYGQGYGGQGYNQGYAGQAYNQGYNANMRVTAITDVQRRSNGLRVRGLISSGMVYGNQGYGAQSYNPGYTQGYSGQGYANRGYAGAGDLSFRCNVDYRGVVSNVRIDRNATNYRRY